MSYDLANLLDCREEHMIQRTNVHAVGSLQTLKSCGLFPATSSLLHPPFRNRAAYGRLRMGIGQLLVNVAALKSSMHH